MLIFAGAVFYYLLDPAEISSITAFWRTSCHIICLRGTVAFLFALYPIYSFACGKVSYLGWKILHFLCILCSQFEETGAFFCALAFILLIAGAIKKTASGMRRFCYGLFGTGCSLFWRLAIPSGLKEEILYWMPCTGSFSIMD